MDVWSLSRSDMVALSEKECNPQETGRPAVGDAQAAVEGR